MWKPLFERTSVKLRCNACITKVELELILEADMYLFFEKSMKDGVSYISTRTF